MTYTMQDAYAGVEYVPEPRNRNPVDIAKGARLLIRDKENWTQHVFKHGNSYCLVGAVHKAAGGWNEVGVDTVVEVLRETLYRKTGERTIARYNDTHTHAEVLELLDTAIARLEYGDVNGNGRYILLQNTAEDAEAIKRGFAA